MSKKINYLICSLATLAVTISCSDRKLIPLKVELGTRSVSKLPFVIAADQGLFEKYGLDVDLRMPAPAFEGGIRTHSDNLPGKVWQRIRAIGNESVSWKADILVDGLTPNMVKRIDQAGFPHRVAIAGIDCIVRAHIVGNRNIRTVEELKGKRLGISARRDTTTGFVALTLAQRMSWDPVKDISIMLNGRDVDALSDGLVDAIVASEVRYALAKKQGFPILLDTQEWNVAIAGNSVMVEAGWMDDKTNQDSARRFLQATIEGLALFHQDRDLALRVMSKWNGITDEESATIIYERGKWLSRSPYPCYEGIANTMELYDSNGMRQYSPEDFYDDSLIRELDQNGFIESIYSKIGRRKDYIVGFHPAGDKL